MLSRTTDSGRRGEHSDDKSSGTISKRLREMMERRIAGLLKADEKEFVGLAARPKPRGSTQRNILIEGQSETIGAYAGAIRFLGNIVGREELFRRPEKPKEPKIEPEQQGLVN